MRLGGAATTTFPSFAQAATGPGDCARARRRAVGDAVGQPFVVALPYCQLCQASALLTALIIVQAQTVLLLSTCKPE